ncbi:MAG: extensin family protein [Allosphingosinicella sp.]|uniref:extensin family protein n=1 Tax=Allosphingosinicella sp. TaxID=2823234 RepID=UPI00395938A3
MRWLISLTLLLLLAACIPRVTPPRIPGAVQPPAGRQASEDPATRQCIADLRREEVEFRQLPDRTFEGGCMAIGAVQLTDIGTPVTNLGAMTCPLARQFARWTRESLQPAAQQWLGSPVRRIESFGTYACRPVNNREGARLSEHAFANAVDVAAFTTADGRRITVLDGWNSPDERVRQFLRAAFQGGCRRFNVGIGPDGDAAHRDHFHFDMGRGPYCR